MLDSVGSVRVRARSARRVELALTRSTAWAGLAIAASGGASLLVAAWWAWLVGGALVVAGLLLATLRRRMIIDRDEGLLRTELRVAGLSRRAAVPLFHLRAAVVARRGQGRRARFVAYLERRVGAPLYLDEGPSAAPLLAIAEAIAEVAEVRLVYEAAPVPGG